MVISGFKLKSILFYYTYKAIILNILYQINPKFKKKKKKREAVLTCK